MKELGLAPNPTGSLEYTVPTIYDPKTKRVVTDSFAIAKYLDETYPDTPNLVPRGTAGLQEAYLEMVVSPLLNSTFPMYAYPVFEQCCMDEADREYVRKSREVWLGKKLEDIALKGEAFDAACMSFHASLDAIAQHASANGTNSLFITGVAPSHVDTAVVSILACILKILGKEHELSKIVLEHSWASRYLQAMSKWE